MRGTGPGRLGEARRGPEPGRDPSLGPDSISAVTFSSQVRRSPGGQLLSASAWVTPSPLWDSRPSLHQGGSPTPMLLLCDPLCGGGEGGGWAGSILGSVPSSSRTPSPSGVTPSPLPSSRLHSGLWNDSGQGAPLAHPPGQAYVPEFIGAPPGGDRRTYTWFLRARSHLRPLRVCARARGCGAWCPRAPGTACSPSVCPGGRLTPEPNRLEWLVLKFLFVSMGPRVESGRDENGWVGCGRVRGIGPGWGSSRDRAPGK